MPCFIVGDVNIDYLKIEMHKDILKYLECLLLYNCLPIPLLPTRITQHSATAIDHIYYYEWKRKNKELQIMSGNIYSDLSDHLPNFVLLVDDKKRINYNDQPLIKTIHTKE